MHNFYRSIFTFSILILVVQFSSGQKNYQDAQIIKLNGEKLNGSINYKNWIKNPKQIKFIEEGTDETNVFTPKEISSISVLGDSYVGAIVEVEISPSGNKLERNPDLNIIRDTVFLKTILDGDKQLYQYRNSKGGMNFYFRSGGEFELLKYKKHLVQEGVDKERVKENLMYKRQLANYLSDCQTINATIGETRYTQKSLLELFLTYHDCIGEAVDFENKKIKKKVDFGLMIGASSSSISFTGREYDYMEEANFTKSINPVLGVSINFPFSGNLNRLSIFNTLFYTSYNSDGYMEVITSDEIYRKETTEIGQSFIKLNTLLRYQYPLNHTQIFLNVGGSYGLEISNTNYRKTVQKLFSPERINEELALSENLIKSYEIGYVFGVGAKYRKYSLELRMEKSDGMTSSFEINSQTNRIFALLTYEF